VQFKIGKNVQTGTAEEVLYEPTNVGSHTVHASESDPMVLIKHDNTGTEFTRRLDLVEEISEPEPGFKEGEKVKFNIGNQEQIGTIQEKLTHKTKVEDHIAHASKRDPMYVIRHDHTGTDFNRRADQVHELNPES